MASYINIVFPGGMNEAFKPAFNEAGAFWNAVITAGASPNTLTDGLDVSGTQCGVDFVYAPGSVVNGLDIFASTPPIDGPGQILGRAGPCMYHGSFSTVPLFPMLGIMEFDSADSAGLVEEGQFGNVVVHEMGHVVGLGTLWPAIGLLNDPCPLFRPAPCDPYYNAANGIEGFRQLNPPSSIGPIPPVANTGGSGTANGHWREVTFENELMTGYLNQGVENPLSIMTVLSLKDLGYSVDTSTAEFYEVPAQAAASVDEENTLRLVGDALTFDLEFIEDVKERISNRVSERRGSSENQEGAFAALFLVMLAGFIALGGYMTILQRKQKKQLEQIVEARVATRSPMHKA